MTTPTPPVYFVMADDDAESGVDVFTAPGQELDEATAAALRDSYLADRRATADCAARPGGHRWTLEGIPEEPPHLSCEDCPASADDLTADCLDLLDGTEMELGGRTVTFGQDLPADAEPFSIPVTITVKRVVYRGGPLMWPEEYDIEIDITGRD